MHAGHVLAHPCPIPFGPCSPVCNTLRGASGNTRTRCSKVHIRSKASTAIQLKLSHQNSTSLGSCVTQASGSGRYAVAIEKAAHDFAPHETTHDNPRNLDRNVIVSGVLTKAQISVTGSSFSAFTPKLPCFILFLVYEVLRMNRDFPSHGRQTTVDVVVKGQPSTHRPLSKVAAYSRTH